MEKIVQLKHIPERVVLQAVADFWVEMRKPFSYGAAKMPPEQLADRYPPRLVSLKMARLADRGMLEYGVSLETAWLTPKGLEVLNSPSEDKSE